MVDMGRLKNGEMIGSDTTVGCVCVCVCVCVNDPITSDIIHARALSIISLQLCIITILQYCHDAG